MLIPTKVTSHDPETKSISNNTARLVECIDTLNNSVEKMDKASTRVARASLALSLIVLMVSILQLYISIIALSFSWFLRILILVVIIVTLYLISRGIFKDLLSK